MGEVCPEEEVTSLVRGSLWTVNRPVNLVWVNPEKMGYQYYPWKMGTTVTLQKRKLRHRAGLQS